MRRPTPPSLPPALSRRGFLAGASALAAGVLLAGCSTGTAIPADPDELVLWYWNRSLDPAALERAAEGIPGHPSRRIRADLTGNASWDTKLRTALAGKAFIPDVVMINSNVSLYFPDEELFTDLDEHGGRARKGDYYDWKWALGTTPTGRHCFWPVDTGPTGFFYRQDVLERAGLPTDPDDVGASIRSWDDFIGFGRQLRKGADAATVITANALFGQVIAASPERWFDRDDRPLFDTDGSAVRRAWEVATRAARDHVTGNLQSGTDQNAGWASGRVAGNIEGAWWTQVVHDTAPDAAGKWRIARQPGWPGNNGGSFLAVPATAKDPAAAAAFVQWITSADVQAQTYNDVQLFPSTPASFTSGVMRNTGRYFGDQDPLGFFQASAADVPTAYISTYERFTSAFTTELTNVEAAGKDPDRAWRDAVDQTNRVLDKRGVGA